MSFILDALRKSEHARQHLGGATLAELPLARRPRGQPWWVFALAALLVANLIGLTLVLRKGSSEPQQAAAPAPTSSIPTSQPAPQPMTSAQRAPLPLAEEASAPPNVEYETIPREESPLATSLDIAPPDGPTLVKPIERSAPPAYTANGLPELHIDMHVYAQNPKDRFVFINMQKYTEGQTMKEGPRIDEITADGVNVFFKGQSLSIARP